MCTGDIRLGGRTPLESLQASDIELYDSFPPTKMPRRQGWW